MKHEIAERSLAAFGVENVAFGVGREAEYYILVSSLDFVSPKNPSFLLPVCYFLPIKLRSTSY
jgi:hypothetical protein